MLFTERSDRISNRPTRFYWIRPRGHNQTFSIGHWHRCSRNSFLSIEWIQYKTSTQRLSPFLTGFRIPTRSTLLRICCQLRLIRFRILFIEALKGEDILQEKMWFIDESGKSQWNIFRMNLRIFLERIILSEKAWIMFMTHNLIIRWIQSSPCRIFFISKEIHYLLHNSYYVIYT